MDSGRNGQQRAGNNRDIVVLKAFLHFAIAAGTADKGDMLHRAERIAVRLCDAFRILEKREQAVAAHVEEVVKNILVGRCSNATRASEVSYFGHGTTVATNA